MFDDTTCGCCTAGQTASCADYYSVSEACPGEIFDFDMEGEDVDGYELKEGENCGWDPLQTGPENNAEGKWTCPQCTNARNGYDVVSSLDECKAICDATTFENCSGFVYFPPGVVGGDCNLVNTAGGTTGVCFFRLATIIDECTIRPGTNSYIREEDSSEGSSDDSSSE